MPDRDRVDLGQTLDELGGEGEHFFDLVGPAVYRLEPTALTVAICSSCRHIGLIPSIPRKPTLTWTCPGCGRGHRLEPPPIVWIEGSRTLAMPPGRPS